MAPKPASKTIAPKAGKTTTSKQPGTPRAAPPVPAAPAKTTPAPVVTLKHLAAQLAEEHGMEKRQAETVMTDVVGLLVAHLKAGDRLRIGGLGILEVKDRPARSGRNPATGEAIQIGASRKIAFRPSKELKDAL